MPTPKRQEEILRDYASKGNPIAKLLVHAHERGLLHLYTPGDPLPTEEKIGIVLGNRNPRVKGAMQHKCSCGAIAWMAPETQEIVAQTKGKHVICCMSCMNRVLGKSKAQSAISTTGRTQ